MLVCCLFEFFPFYLVPRRLDLLSSMQKGQLAIQLDSSKSDDLIVMLPIVACCITLLPCGMSALRQRLLNTLNKRIRQDGNLRMHFIFFLHSFFLNPDIRRVFGKHRLMKQVKHISSFYNYKMVPATPSKIVKGNGIMNQSSAPNSQPIMSRLGSMQGGANSLGPGLAVERVMRGYSIQSAHSFTGQGGGDLLDSPQAPDSPTAESLGTMTITGFPSNYMIQQVPNPSYSHRLSLYDRGIADVCFVFLFLICVLFLFFVIFF